MISYTWDERAKKKITPLSEKLIRVLKILSTKKNCDFTIGNFRIIILKMLAIPIPRISFEILSLLRLLERLYAIINKAIMPKNPVYIIIYSFLGSWKQFLHVLHLSSSPKTT